MLVSRRPQVIGDLIEATEFIAQDDPQIAVRFLEAFEQNVLSLQSNPEIGAVREFSHSKLQKIRMWFVQGFPNHLIFYQVIEKQLEIVRVLHSAQDYNRILKSN